MSLQNIATDTLAWQFIIGCHTPPARKKAVFTRLTARLSKPRTRTVKIAGDMGEHCSAAFDALRQRGITLPCATFISQKQIRRHTGLDRSVIDVCIKKDLFPDWSEKQGERLRLWRVSDIEKWARHNKIAIHEEQT